MSFESTKLTEIINEDKWQQITSRFVDVLRMYIFTLDQKGNIILTPNTERYGGQLLMDPALGLGLFFDDKNFGQQFVSHGSYLEAKGSYGLHCYAVPIQDNSRVVGYVVVGPLILNKKMEEHDYERWAREKGVSSAKLLDQIREVRVVSHVVLSSILDLLSAIVHDLVELNVEKKKIEQIRLKDTQLPKEFSHMAQEIYSAVRLDELLVTLLDVALKITNTECGSIMVVDKEKSELVVKASKGLEEKNVKNSKLKMGEGIAGLAAQENQSFFISGKGVDNRIKHLLKRPEIKESLVMPLVTKNRVFGVLNLSTKFEQSRIGEHLENLQYISKIISAAL